MPDTATTKLSDAAIIEALKRGGYLSSGEAPSKLAMLVGRVRRTEAGETNAWASEVEFARLIQKYEPPALIKARAKGAEVAERRGMSYNAVRIAAGRADGSTLVIALREVYEAQEA